MRLMTLNTCLTATLLILALLCIAAWPARAKAAGALKPERLRCEYLDNPIGLDEARPRLTWALNSTRRAERQTAWQVRVATSEKALQQGGDLLWYSGKVPMGQGKPDTCVYAGKPLAAGQRAWWQVRVWDAHYTPSEWSKPASWEMGLLAPGDWHGQWIARTTDIAAAPTPLLRRAFTLDGKIRRARLYVAGVGYHELYINGQRIGDHRLDPGYTRYDRRVLYVTHDVTKALQRGENAIGVMLGNGWLNVQEKAAWDFDQAPWRMTPRLLLELRVELEDGRTVTLSSGPDWKSSDSPITFSCIYGGETYDARLEQPGWDRPGFDDTKWQAAQVVEAPKGKLTAQAMPPIKVTRVLKPAKVTEPKPGVFVYDFGQNMAGFAELNISGPAGAKVVMKYSEHLAQDGTADQSNIGVHVWQEGKDQPFQTDTYILKGRGQERWHSRFDYHGFQYVEVSGAPGKLTADNLRACFLHSAIAPVGTFECSNPLLNKIWENAHWAYLSNLQGIPTDCPHREKNGWTGDAHLACEQGLLSYDGIAVYEKWINDLADEQKPTGELPGIVPTGGWGYAWGNGPAWDSAFLLVPYYIYQYYGDARLLERHYEGMRRYVDYLTGKAQDGIVTIGLGDWAPWKTKTPEALTSTAYYYVDTQIVSLAAQLLGRWDDVRKYSALAQSIEQAFNKKFYHPETGLYDQGSQTALSCALYQFSGDFTTPRHDKIVQDNLVAAVEKTGGHIDTGILGAKYLLNTLTMIGRTDLAYRIVTQEDQPGWGWWIKQGATTLWEHWDGTASQNHIMYGDVAAWMVKALAGIQMVAPAPNKAVGYRQVFIRPNPVKGLDWARASYDSVQGRIASAWKQTEKEFRLELEIPPNTIAHVKLPTDNPAKIREGGRPLAQAQGVTVRLEKEMRRNRRPALWDIEVESGKYVFTVER